MPGFKFQKTKNTLDFIAHSEAWRRIFYNFLTEISNFKKLNTSLITVAFKG